MRVIIRQRVMRPVLGRGSRRRRGGRGSGRGGLAGLLLVLRADAVRGHLLQAAFLAARLVARLGQLTALPLVIVEEAVALGLVRALASFDAAGLPVPLGLRGPRLAALGRRLWHPGAPVRPKK